MKITIYELLGMIKDGKAGDITTNFMFERKEYNLLAFLDEYTLDINSLNWEVEIIEEKKIPEKLPYYSMEKIQKAKNKDEWREERITLLEKRVNDLHIKMNDLIDYLKSKGDDIN